MINCGIHFMTQRGGKVLAEYVETTRKGRYKCEIYHMQHGEGYTNDDLVLENCNDGLQNKVYTLLQDKCKVTHQVVMHV